ncbi:MAG: M6 family metalloprotease domain-containing protein [Candidatus Zixiibacteriota bacterium]
MKHILILFLLMAFAGKASAVAPSDEVIAGWKADGIYQHRMEQWNDFKKNGGCAPVKHSLFNKNKFKKGLSLGVNAVDTVRVVVLMVDFDDHPWDGQSLAGTPQDFDSILFSNRDIDAVNNPTGSMTDYYLENSYGQFYIIGDIYGWYRMPHNYSYYTNNSSGINPFGISGRDLADDAVTLANDSLDFSIYDFNNDGNCDGVVIIHSGPGAETTGDSTDIWSHKWAIRNPRIIDGVYVSNYNINPEENGNNFSPELSPIGVFCHEFGHFLNLPDLYDTENTSSNSSGLGKWSLMASGNGNGGSKRPAHLDAWCKKEVGFISLIDVTDNIYQAEIPQIESEPVAYRLQNSNSQGQYWIVENRQKAAFDASLPGKGLLIYHVNESVPNNDNPIMYKVALEQADGEDALAFSGSRGDGGDPFPGFTNNRNLHEFTVPNSKTYNGNITQIGVWNISDSDSLMWADLDVSYSRPWLELSGTVSVVFDDSAPLGNGNGVLEAGETIRFFFKIKNLMRMSYNVNAVLSTNNPDVNFVTNNITVNGNLGSGEFNNAGIPIEFTLSDTLVPVIDSFFLAIITDSLNGIAGSDNYAAAFGVETFIGKSNILIVDDDRGDNYEQVYQQSLYNKSLPSDVWDINTKGTPTINDLLDYDIVIWHTGDTASSSLNAEDIAVMRQYLDNNKNLLLSTANGAQNMSAIDPTFMADYFHAAYDKDTLWPTIEGIPGNAISENTVYRYDFNSFVPTQTLTVLGEGVPVFTTKYSQYICGVSYSGTFKTVLLSFPIELLDDKMFPTYEKKETLITRVIEFFGGISLSIYDGQAFTQLPKSFDLNQNYPNPFNPTTTISYTIRAAGNIGSAQPLTILSIYNILGQNVKTLIDEVQVPGTYNIDWDGTDQNNQKVSTGIYFYRLTRGEDFETKKMILLK